MPSKPTPTNLPTEAIELYNDFVHGEISRRSFMEGIHKVTGSWAPHISLARCGFAGCCAAHKCKPRKSLF